jgi:hypothetical protein
MNGQGKAESANLPPVRVAAVGSHSPSSPSFRIRMMLPRPHLAKTQVFLIPLTLFTEAEEKALHQVSLATKLTLSRAARRRLLVELDSLPSDVSVTLIQRQADIFPTKTVEKHAMADRPLVYDVDDAIWLDGRAANGSILAFIKGSRSKAKWLARRAEHVIAGNEVLAEYLAHYSKRVTVIPSVVDTAESPIRTHADADDLTIGWIGSRTTAPYVRRLSKLLPQVANRLDGKRLRLVMVGGRIDPPDRVAYEPMPWSVENERRALEQIDIGILPQPDTPWARGKCAYKAIQCMAAGIPVVADKVGVTADVLADAGVVVGGESEWIEALLELAKQPKLRAEMGARGRRRAEREYSLERWAPVVGDVLRSVG